MKVRYWLFAVCVVMMLVLAPSRALAQSPPEPPPQGQAFTPPDPPLPPFADGPEMGPQRGFGPRRGLEGFGPGYGFGAGPMLGRLQEELGLTPEQQTKLRQQFMESRKAAVRARADQEIKRMELHELMEAENPDRAQIDRKLRELADLRYNMEKSRVDQMLNFRQALTPEQRTKLRQLRNQFGRRGFRGGPGTRRGPGRGPGPGPEGRPPAPPTGF